MTGNGCTFFSDGIEIWVGIDFTDADAEHCFDQLSYETAGFSVDRWTAARS